MAMSLYGQLDISKISTNLNIADLVKTISDLLFRGRFLVSMHCKSNKILEVFSILSVWCCSDR